MPGWQHNKPPAPKHSKEQRTRILRRDPFCHCPGCHRCTSTTHCARPSTEADHIKPRHMGGANIDTNMQGLCTPCHGVKSAREGRNARPSTRHTREQHPGLS